MEAPQQRGKGRPKIGGYIPGMNLGDVLKERVERWAAEEGTDRTDAIKTLLTRQLDAEDERRRPKGRTWEAVVPHTKERFRFRSLSALAVRLGGTTYEVQPQTTDLDALEGPVPFRVVVIKKGTRRVFRVHVPVAAVDTGEGEP